MSLAKSISSTLKMCQFGGLSSYSYSESAGHWRFNPSLALLNKLLIILLTTSSIITCVYQEKIIRRDKGETAVITLALWLIMINFRAFVNLLESSAKQDQHLKIMNSFRELEKMFENIVEYRVRCRFIKNMCHKFIILLVTEWIALLTIQMAIDFNSGDSFDLKFWIAYSFPYLFTRLSQMQIMTYILLIRQKVLMLSEYSQKMAKMSELPKRKLFATRAIIKVESWPANQLVCKLDESVIYRVQKMHRLIWECSVIVNDITFWSAPIGIFNDFIILIFNTFWFVVFLLDDLETPFELFLFLFLWILSTLKAILFTTISCEMTNSAVSQYSVQYNQ